MRTCWETCACTPGSGRPAAPASPGTPCRRRGSRRQSRWWHRGAPGSGARRTAQTASPPSGTDTKQRLSKGTAPGAAGLRPHRATSRAQAWQPRPPQAPMVLLRHHRASSLVHQVVPAAARPSLTVRESKLRSQQIPACFARIPETPGCFLRSPWFPACLAAQHSVPGGTPKPHRMPGSGAELSGKPRGCLLALVPTCQRPETER